ncbi:MAG: NADH-quinone oxidoreductase subunit H [Candidatus Eisenbacteria bacterium]|nr:NADH-quinone oxidoreductase subunit H [Candidatus Eisenbacteria bacterium]
MWVDVTVVAALAFAAALAPLMSIPLLVWAERKMSAFIQDRTGPNRAEILGLRLGGLVHPFADVVKLITKEDLTPERADRFYYTLAPFLALFVSLLAFAILPLADTLHFGGRALPMRALTLNAGILYILAVTGFHVYAVVIAGWASHNGYALLGGLRSAAQMVSYELALGLSLVGVVLVAGTLDPGEIVAGQSGVLFGFLPRWNVFLQPVGFVLFLIALFAETNRNPFDLPEGESEIIGFHVEYSSMRFASFFMAEYASMFTGSAVAASLFFGGWQVPWIGTEALRANAPLVARVAFGALAAFCIVAALIAQGYKGRLARLYRDRRSREATVLQMIFLFTAAVSLILLAFLSTLPPWGAQVLIALVQGAFLLGKTLAFTFLFIWVRWTLPRFRYDQLMGLGWKSLVPLALLNLAVTGIVLLWFD